MLLVLVYSLWVCGVCVCVCVGVCVSGIHTLGTHREQLMHRTFLTCPRPFLFFPWLRRLTVMMRCVDMCGGFSSFSTVQFSFMFSLLLFPTLGNVGESSPIVGGVGVVGTIGMDKGEIGAGRTGGSTRAVDAGSGVTTDGTGEATAVLRIVTKHGVA